MDGYCSVRVIYALEPLLMVIFVINMNTAWEKILSTLSTQVFGRELIQTVEFFEQYKVGELTALLTSDLGSPKSVVGENISRDCEFRALSEASNATPGRMSIFVAVYKRLTVPVFSFHGLAQVSISDCVRNIFRHSYYEHFSYPLRPNVEIPSGLHLTLKCGTITALVGPSRAGRSTIVQLLALYYEQSNRQGVQFSWKTKEGNHKKSSIGSTVAIPTNSRYPPPFNLFPLPLLIVPFSQTSTLSSPSIACICFHT